MGLRPREWKDGRNEKVEEFERVLLMAYVRRRTTAAGHRFDVCWREKARHRSRTFTFRKDAERFRVEVERRSQLGPLFEAPPATLDEWWTGYLDRWSVGKADGTVRRRVEVWGVLGTLHDLPLSDITRAVAEDAVVAVARRAPRQAHLALALLKAMLRDAQQRGHRIDSGALTLAPPSYDEREPVYLTFQQLAALASWSAEPKLILFAGLSGLRQGECFALHDKDVHLKGRYVFVSRGAYKGEPTRTKSRQRRRVYSAPRRFRSCANNSSHAQLAHRSSFQPLGVACGAARTSWSVSSGRLPYGPDSASVTRRGTTAA
jgi:integrase